MTTQQFIENIRQTYAKGITIIEKKNADYANSTNPFRNFESASIVGIGIERAILLRVLDKLSRASNLLDKAPTVVDESLEDTLLDAINYLAILKAYRERNRVTEEVSKLIPSTGCAICGDPKHDAWLCPNAGKL